MNDADSRGNFADYIIFRKNLLFRSDYFEICAAQLRKDGSQRICKIYKKNSLTTKKFNMTNIRREIFVHKKLETSDCILKFQEIFEYQQEIYLMFENAELLGDDFMISELVLQKEQLSQLFGNILVGLNEINSLRIAVCSIHRGMIAKTGPGEYKLFNLIHLNYYD